MSDPITCLWLLAVVALLTVIGQWGYGPSWVLALVRGERELALSVLQAAAVRRRWRWLARGLGLVLVDRARRGPFGSSTTASELATHPVKYRAPAIRVSADPFGVVVNVKTVPGVGYTEMTKAAPYLADAWQCCRVSVTATTPGRLRVRGVRRDPLETPTTYAPPLADLPDPGDLRSVHLGVDEYGEPVSVRLDGVSGIAVGGLPGYGKTSLIALLVAKLAPSSCVQFVVLDGKNDSPMDGDYADLADRAVVMVGDDLQAANGVLTRLEEFRRARQRSVRAIQGSANGWDRGPTPQWPLLVAVIDECQVYFKQVKDGGSKTIKDRNALADQNAQLVEGLIKKGRAVNILTIVITQKQTGDSIPTSIRDVCSVSLAFACRTMEAAVAALGEDIRQCPDASPVALQDPRYIGVAAMVVPGRAGFTRVRFPFVASTLTRSICSMTSALTGCRGELPPVPDLIGIDAAHHHA